MGCRTLEHLKGNIEAVNLKLSKEEIKEIEAAVPFELGFPTGFLYSAEIPKELGNIPLLGMGGNLVHLPGLKPFARE